METKLFTKYQIEKMSLEEMTELCSKSHRFNYKVDYHEICKDCKCDGKNCCNNPDYCEYVTTQ